MAYRSGWLLDTFAMGATLYGSAPLYAPEDKDGTLLLKPGQEGYYVPGEAWGALRYKDYALLKGYRQRVDQTYINPQDNRMTPNTFEGVTLGGKVAWVQYLGRVPLGHQAAQLRRVHQHVPAGRARARTARRRRDRRRAPDAGRPGCGSTSATRTASTPSTRSIPRSTTSGR